MKPYAEKGNAAIQHLLGIMNFNGQGGPKDFVTAARWYKLAAEQGFAPSQSALALMYALGIGVIQDNVSAYMWNNLSAASGEKSALEIRDTITKGMTKSQIAEAQKLSRECLKNNYKNC